MNRPLQCAMGALLLFVSSGASAADFAQKGQIAISAERLFGFTYDSATVSLPAGDQTVKVTGFNLLSSPVDVSGQNWRGYGTPRIAGDYFIIDRLSLGAALGYAHSSATSTTGLANTELTVSGDSFTFAPRVGYAFALNDLIGIWPRGGFTYRTFSAGNVSTHDLALTLEVPFTFNILPHVVVWGGPTLDLGVSGAASVETGNGSTTSRDFNATEFGIQSALLVYFGT